MRRTRLGGGVSSKLRRREQSKCRASGPRAGEFSRRRRPPPSRLHLPPAYMYAHIYTLVVSQADEPNGTQLSTLFFSLFFALSTLSPSLPRSDDKRPRVVSRVQLPPPPLFSPINGRSTILRLVASSGPLSEDVLLHQLPCLRFGRMILCELPLLIPPQLFAYEASASSR